ncbi:phospholipase D-like domain-containing protein [Halorubrum ezzemoulense]|uniref:helicase-related protein n=1 Tax=Halorubrum ezzemoulense TaxID=337243 RepID=UPI0023312146|nr:helicase-related protein [Halorubrum ezzemoulense]MDB9302157.1 phospholipase D-like domain-containing protein [Halorubrum ezzemoulense]
MTRPEFIDNREGNTLAVAINEYIDDLREKMGPEPNLDIATGYFNPRGYFEVADALDQVGEVRLLLGAQPDQKDTERWRQPGEPRGEDYNQKRLEESLKTLDRNLDQDRDLLGFSRRIDSRLQQLVDFLRSDDVKVRRYEERFLHGKAYLFSHDQGTLVGSSNFTGAGLTSNMELNVGQYSPSVTGQVNEWFEDIWADAEPYDLASIYEERFEPYDPYLIYLRVLYERYGDELEEEAEDDGAINLTNFQQDGVRRAERFLDEHNGVVVADEVGLGKTYIAGKLLEKTVNENRQRALVVAPAYLRDGMWESKAPEWGVQFETLSYSELRNERQLGGDRSYLDLDKEEYQLVIIDEAHAFRNPGTQQADALRQLLRDDPPKDVVMLTATPVNNSLWDLYYLLYYFIKNDAAFASEGIRSLRDRFKHAQSEDPSDLSPDLLFDVLDETTVRRTRRFIREHYENATLPDGDGGEVRITFPESQPRRIDYDFSDTFGDAFFEDVAEGLAAGDRDESELSLARYRPSYYLEGEEDASELSLVGLLRTGLLKRFESSSKAFANTLERMINQNRAALNLLNNGMFPKPDAIEEWVEADSDEALDEAFDQADNQTAYNLGATETEVEEFRQDLKADLEILQGWYERVSVVTQEQDEKLDTLGETLVDIVEDAEEDAGTDPELEVEEAFQQNRKVIIFSYYADTVEWILDYLEERVQNDDTLSCYEGRIAGVTGDGSVRGITREDAVHGFAPDSADAPAGVGDQYDILVTTDVLAQGVNLQQARNVINYDLPWNPMRVVQRNGRIDRINSPHPEIFPMTFFPEDRLDDLLELELRVRRKVTQAARSIGLDSQVIPDMDTMQQNFSDRVDDIESIREEDEEVYEKGGGKAAAYSGEEYRQELREGLEDRGDQITSLPWAAGSGFRGENPGYFFCARVGDEMFMRFVPDNDETEIIDDTLTCLQRIDCDRDTPRELPNEFKEGVYGAWEDAKVDIWQQWQEQTDPRSVQPDVPKAFREAIEQVRDYWPPELSQNRQEELIDSLGAPWPQQYEREMRELVRDEGLEGEEKTREIVDKADDLGLQPYDAPEPLPPIREEEVKLICWMAVAPEQTDEDESGPTLVSQSTL